MTSPIEAPSSAARTISRCASISRTPTSPASSIMPIISNSWSGRARTCCAPPASTSAPRSRGGEGVYAVAEVDIKYRALGEARRRSARAQRGPRGARRLLRSFISESCAGLIFSPTRRSPPPSSAGGPAEAPAARVGRGVRAAEEGRTRWQSSDKPADLMSPVTLFLQADIVVKIGDGRACCSPASGPGRSSSATALRMRRDQPRERAVRARFLEGRGYRQLLRKPRQRATCRRAKVLAAGIAEWRRSTAGASVDRDGTRARLAVAMNAAVAAETDRLADRLNILATVGSVAPFVGLFGTVWGIMRSFTDIAGAQQHHRSRWSRRASPRRCSPPRIGLFAAIPAVIAYNRFSYGINRLEARLQPLRRRLPRARLSRELEVEALRWRWARSSARGAARPPRADGGDQRHAAGRRDAGAADHLHGHRAAAGRRRPGRPARQQGGALEQTGQAGRRSRSTARARSSSTTRRSPRDALGRPARSRSPRRAASRAGRASSCAPTAALDYGRVMR